MYLWSVRPVPHSNLPPCILAACFIIPMHLESLVAILRLGYGGCLLPGWLGDLCTLHSAACLVQFDIHLRPVCCSSIKRSSKSTHSYLLDLVSLLIHYRYPTKWYVLILIRRGVEGREREILSAGNGGWTMARKEGISIVMRKGKMSSDYIDKENRNIYLQRREECSEWRDSVDMMGRTRMAST